MWIYLLACQTPTEEASVFTIDAQLAGQYAPATDVSESFNTAGEVMPIQLWYSSLEAPDQIEPDDRVRYDGFAQGGAIEADAYCPQARPVVMFSHGDGGIRYNPIFG